MHCMGAHPRRPVARGASHAGGAAPRLWWRQGLVRGGVVERDGESAALPRRAVAGGAASGGGGDGVIEQGIVANSKKSRSDLKS